MDEDLEKAITETGREKVFQTAQDRGWGNETPPKWVWWAIVNELRAASPQS